jgi:hypothetical protein
MIGWLEFENCAFPCIHLSSPPTAETPNSSTAHASIPISLNNPSNPYFTKDSGVNKKNRTKPVLLILKTDQTG